MKDSKEKLIIFMEFLPKKISPLQTALNGLKHDIFLVKFIAALKHFLGCLK